MPSTKNSPSSPQSLVRDSGASLCDNLLWIGDSEHFQMHAAWQVCRTHCDSISYRGDVQEAIESAPRRMPTHLIVAQTNRHDSRNLAIDAPALGQPALGQRALGQRALGQRALGQWTLGQLRSRYPHASLLVLRSPLVAPTVRLPPVSSPDPSSETDSGWVESISAQAATDYLPHWLSTPGQQHSDDAPPLSSALSNSVLPTVIVAARYCAAEPLIDSLSSLCTSAGGGLPLIQWQRALTPRSARGFANVLWDESAAAPTTAEDWRARCGRAAQARHVWMTAMANWQQRQLARENGVHTVLEKPGRLESLIAGLAAAQPSE